MFFIVGVADSVGHMISRWMYAMYYHTWCQHLSSPFFFFYQYRRYKSGSTYTKCNVSTYSSSKRVVGDPNDIVSSFFILFLLHHLKPVVDRCFVISCSGLLPLDWLTLRSSICICIALVDHVIHGYGHCQRWFQF